MTSASRRQREKMVEMPIRIGVDIGGTFTDVALHYAAGLVSTKVLTDYAQPEQAILDGIREVCRKAGVAPSRIAQLIHGTTLVTNALIERRGARLAFITTEGFRDVVEMRTESRFEQYEINLVLPQPLVGREHRYTVRERIAADGSVLLDLSEEEVAGVVEKIRAGGYEAVAVGLMHSYVNGEHERRIGDALRAAMPEVAVSLSSVISPQMREFERFNTVLANAYVQPQVADYLGRLVQRLREEGISAPVYMMHSGGGLISVATATEQPVRLLESGPAGGAIYAAEYARSYGIARALSFDMGGTTAKICLVENATPRTANTFEVARTYRFKKGSGMPVSTPVVEMVEIGAGGGSIASLDSMQRIAVGPRSAGSTPGPASYQLGGTEPTVTDANLVLGRLDPDNFAGAKIVLSRARAEQALTDRLAAIGTPFQAAFGVIEVVDENMANAARVHAVENGRDIETFTMIAFGGGAPVHACRLCEKLGIDTLLVPPGAGVGSAIGFLRAPFSYEATRGLYQRLDRFDTARVRAALAEMAAEAANFLADAVAGEAPLTRQLTAYMRYSGQGWEIPVALDHESGEIAGPDELRTAFEQGYRELFGRTIDKLEVEITNWSLRLSTALPPAVPVARRAAERVLRPASSRPIYDAARRSSVEAGEFERAQLTPGACVQGPAVIVEEETSIIVTAAFDAIGQDDGCILLQRKEARQ